MIVLIFLICVVFMIYFLNKELMIFLWMNFLLILIFFWVYNIVSFVDVFVLYGDWFILFGGIIIVFFICVYLWVVFV